MPITKRGLANVEARQLTHHLTKFDAILQEAINRHGANITKQDLKEAYTPKDTTPESVSVLYKAFLKEKQTQGTVTQRSLQKYNVVFLKYKEYCSKNHLSYNIKDLDDNFYVGFITFLRYDHNLNDNTLARYLSFFKTFVIWCKRKGVKINNDYKNVSVKKYQSDDIALTVEEVKTLEDAELTGPEQKARDLFINVV